MTDWTTCPAVERTPGKVSGAWVFAGTRIPLFALYENLAAGATVYAVRAPHLHTGLVMWELGFGMRRREFLIGALSRASHQRQG